MFELLELVVITTRKYVTCKYSFSRKKYKYFIIKVLEYLVQDIRGIPVLSTLLVTQVSFLSFHLFYFLCAALWWLVEKMKRLA